MIDVAWSRFISVCFWGEPKSKALFPLHEKRGACCFGNLLNHVYLCGVCVAVCVCMGDGQRKLMEISSLYHVGSGH